MSGSLAEDTQAPGRLRCGQRGLLQALAVYTFISLLANGAGAETENIAQSVSDPSAFAAIQDPVLYKWKEQLGSKGEKAFRGPGRKTASEESEVARLKRELEKVTEERDILKKAAAYFARELP